MMIKIIAKIELKSALENINQLFKSQMELWLQEVI